VADRLQSFVQGIFRTEAVRSKASQSDGALLASYVTSRDEAAFEALVRRHAAMVWGVCRRTLGNDHDAEDAVQATFLILTCKAASIRPPGMVGNWLYGVARTTALKARALIQRRQLKENHAALLSAQNPNSDAERLEFRQILDEELSRLPAKYRVPIVLCDLEGLSRKEAFERLGWLEGTLSGRLARGRALLGRRLLRRGFGLMAGAGAISLACCPETHAGVPPRLLSAILEAAFSNVSKSVALGTISATVQTLTRGVIRSMFYGTLARTAAAFLALTTLVAGAGLVLHRADAGQQKSPVPSKKDDSSKQVTPAVTERKEADCIAEMVDAANKECDSRMKEYYAGRGTLEFLYDSSRRLLQAELEKSSNKAERVAALKAHFSRMLDVEKINILRFEAGKVATQDLESSRFYRCEAELNLIRENKR
jgi:RNA polymerase sigma factor (sigma-70 family)